MAAAKKVDPILSAPTIGDFKKRFYNLVVKEGHASAATGDALLPPLLSLHYTIFVAVTTHNAAGVGIGAAFVPYTDAVGIGAAFVPYTDYYLVIMESPRSLTPEQRLTPSHMTMET